MAGDERVRHCSLCSLNVYNFAEMTGEDVRELLMRTEGRVCARLYRRADGTVLTRDCPTGLRAVRQRASRIAAAVVAALLSIPSLAFGGTSCKPRLITSGSKVKLTVEHVPNAQAAVLTGVVRMDRTALPGVTVTVRDETTNRYLAAVTDANGAFTITPLQAGIYRVEFTLAGFTTATLEHLEINAGEVIHASAALRTAFTMGALAPMITPDAGTTTVSSELLQKLPF